jgi:hypothetical protein
MEDQKRKDRKHDESYTLLFNGMLFNLGSNLLLQHNFVPG